MGKQIQQNLYKWMIWNWWIHMAKWSSYVDVDGNKLKKEQCVVK